MSESPMSRREFVASAAAATAGAVALGSGLEPATAAAPAAPAPAPFSAEANQEYVLYWLPYGVRGVGPEGTRAFHVQTPHYLVGFDFDRMSFTRFAALPAVARKTNPDTRGEALFARAALASLKMSITTADGEYLLSGGKNGDAKLSVYDGGKFCYQLKVENARFRRDDGTFLAGKTVLEFFPWSDKLFVTVSFQPDKDLSVRGARLLLTFAGDYDRYFGVDGARRVRQTLAPGSPVKNRRMDLNAFYRAGKGRGGSGVAVLASERADFESHRVERGASGVTYTASLYEEADHGGRPQTWAAGKARVAGFQILGTLGDHESRCLEDVADERSHVEVTILGSSSGRTDLYGGYVARKGYYLLTAPTEPAADIKLYREKVNHTEDVRFRLANKARTPRKVRLMLDKAIAAAIEGPSAVLLDRDGWPTGLDVQISKNWHVAPPWYHVYTVLHLKPGQVQDQTLAVVYQNWGTKPTVHQAQLSLVGYDDAGKWPHGVVYNQLWYEMGQGLAESVCYDPTSTHTDNVITDMRPMFFPERTGSWCGTNMGGADFLVYHDPSGKKQTLTRPKVYHDKQCLNLTDITHALVSPDGKVRQRVRTRSFANTDLVRCLFTIRTDVLEDLSFSKFSIFTLGAPNYNAHHPRKMAVGDAAGLKEVRAIEAPVGYLTPGVPVARPDTWIALYDGVDPPTGDGGANRGLIVRSYRAKINGAAGKVASLDVNRVKGQRYPVQVIVELNPAGANGRLKAGDFIETEVEMLIYTKMVPAYVGPDPTMKHLLNTYGDSWQPVYWDARHNSLQVKASGKPPLGKYPLIIDLDAQGRAELEVTGGMGHIPIEIRGYQHYRNIALQQQVGGAWKTVDQSVRGKDFWQAQYDPDTGRYTGIFSVPVHPTDETRLKNRFRVIDRAPDAKKETAA